MSIRSIALRALLGLCLVLNGTGTAMAAVQMATTAIEGNTVASLQQSGDMTNPAAKTNADCHDQDMMADAGHSSAMTHDGTSNPHTSPDCCKYGACQCACAQHAPIAVALFMTGGSIGVTGIALHALADGRPAPAPDVLLRPPIA